MLPINSELFDEMFWENALDSIRNETADDRQKLAVGSGVVRKLTRVVCHS